MKKYQFKLERVLELKRLKEKLQLKELGQEVRDQLQKQASVDESRGLKHSFDQRYRQIDREGRINPLNFRLHQSYSSVLGQEIKKGEKEVEDQKLKVDQVRERVRLAHRETKSFEMLKEKSLHHYKQDLRKEEEKELNEVGLNRARLRQHQTGSALNVLMAIGSSALVVFLLAVGLMFGLGNLSLPKLQLITQIIQYDESYFKDSKQIVGDEHPYLVNIKDYTKLKEQAEKYQKWEKGQLDNEVVITEEILDHRKDLLQRLERNIKRIQSEVNQESAGLKAREEQLAAAQAKLMEDRKMLEEEKQGRANEKLKKAQAEMLKSFSAMEPEDVVNAFTGGKTVQELVNQGDINAVVDKAVSYLSQMSARQRAGVLQAMEPELTTVVVQKLETSYPL